MKFLALIAFAVVLLSTFSAAKIITRSIEYKENDTVLEGFLAFDDTNKSLRPGVLIIHQWKGITQYEKNRAVQLAELGYVAFAADIYGKGIRPTTNAEASSTAGVFYKDPELLRRRAEAALRQLKNLAEVDSFRVAAIGYCFGGKAVLELARSGANLIGVVSFHGGLDTQNPADARNIKAKILVLHGASDPHVGPDKVAAFEKEMTEAGVDWQLIAYGGAVHSFTIPDAGNDPSTGSAYDEKADRRSWVAMRQFLDEVFR